MMLVDKKMRLENDESKCAALWNGVVGESLLHSLIFEHRSQRCEEESHGDGLNSGMNVGNSKYEILR